MSAWQYIQRIWDFSSNSTKLPWFNTPEVPPTIQSSFEMMEMLGDQYGSWLWATLAYWRSRNDCIRANNTTWRDEIQKERPGVAAVLPENYHPDTHRELLSAAGVDTTVVDQILRGFNIQGTHLMTGFYEGLPSPSREEIEEYNTELTKALDAAPRELERLLQRRPATDGQIQVLEHT